MSRIYSSECRQDSRIGGGSVMPVVVVDLENSEVMFPPGSATKCADGYLQFTGKVCFRSEPCSTSSNVCHDHYARILLKKLAVCKQLGEVIDVLDDLIGGWTVVYYREDIRKVFVGRDVFGRKSLLWTRTNGKFHFSNFACCQKWGWHDVPAGTVTVFDLCRQENNTLYHIFEVGELWIQQFTRLNKVERKAASGRLAISPELPFEKVCREVTAKVMLEQLKGAVLRTFCGNNATKCLSVSFSGGVDSLLIVHMLAQCMPSDVLFDLVNVAFDNNKQYDGVPDRVQSKKAYQFLKCCYPGRCIRLLLVNVDMDELVQCRRKFISNAVAPACSVLDDSIGCVQWFAARGEGLLYEDEEKLVAEKSDAKIVVVGSGADELFGGYMRHRTSFLRNGRKAVLEELCRELKRIGERNLGRDDRIASSLGKDLRSPFLDDLFVEWATSLPFEYKADFTQPRGTGEKWLIRESLKLLGTPEALCAAPKRAMQFGSRIAKLENRNERGDDFCPRLLQEGI